MKRLSGLCLSVAFLAGCVPSIEPAYTGKDLVLEPALVGTWSTGNPDDGVWTVTRGEGSFYWVSFSEKGKAGTCRGHFFKVGGLLLLDLCPEPDAFEDLPDLTKVHVQRVHTVNRIWIDGEDAVRYATLDGDRVRALAAAWNPPLPLSLVEGKPVLTAAASQLQAFLAGHADDPALFTKPVPLKRKK